MWWLWLIIFLLFSFVSLVTASDNLVCPIPSNNTPPRITFSEQNNPEFNASQFTEQITAYLNATHSTVGLQDAISVSFVQDTDVAPYITAQVLNVDVTNDQVMDIVTSINVAYGAGYQNYITVFGCVNNAYVAMDTVISKDWSNWFVEDASPGTIELIIDTNGNGIPEIILRERTLTGQKYGEKLTFFEWQADHLVSTFHLPPDYGGFGTLVVTNRDTNPTTVEVVIENRYGYGQAVATAFNEVTHYRDIEMVYQWDGKAYQKICQVFADTPTTLYETLQSAEAHRACGEHASAEWYYAELWQRSKRLQSGVNPLEVKMSPEDAEAERGYLRAFAGYRLIQLAVQRSKTEQIDSILEALQADYPVGKHGYAYAAMAIRYWETYQQTQQSDAACAAAKTTFDAAKASGDDPGIIYEDTLLPDGRLIHFGFYKPGIFHQASDPDNVFAVPEELADMVQIPVCFE